MQKKLEVFELKYWTDEQKSFPSQTADFSGLLMFYECRSTDTAL